MDVSVFLYVEGLLFIWFWCGFFFYWIPFEKLSQKDIFVFLCNLLCFSSNFNAILLLFLQKNRLYQLLMANENVLAIFFFFKISTILHIWKVYRIFDFHPILMHFFLWIDLWRAYCQRISSISYGFRLKLDRKPQVLNSQILTLLFLSNFNAFFGKANVSISLSYLWDRKWVMEIRNSVLPKFRYFAYTMYGRYTQLIFFI